MKRSLSLLAAALVSVGGALAVSPNSYAEPSDDAAYANP